MIVIARCRLHRQLNSVYKYKQTHVKMMQRFMSTLYSPKYLVYTNTATGALFLCAADYLEQKIETKLGRRKQELDVNRNVSMLATGTYFGLVGHAWYTFLDRKFPGPTRKVVSKKLICEGIVGPPFAASLFFIVGKMEKKSVAESWKDLKQNFLLLCVADWCFYIPLQALNFFYLPTKYRFLFVACISLVYDTFLSFVLHR